MPSQADHLRIARANRTHAELLLSQHPGDPTAMQWAVVAAFYCAVHCMEAHFALRQIHFTSHYERQVEMASPISSIPNDVYEAFMALRQRCDAARYYGQPISSVAVRDKVLGKLLSVVTAFVGL